MEIVLVPILISLFDSPAVLLGIRVADTDVTWSHGVPEYTFNVKYVTYLQPESEAMAEKIPSQNWGTNLISKLKCTPDNQMQTPKLHCHFNCTKFVKLTSETYKTAVNGLLKDVKYTNLDLGDASFVINPDGIEEYKFNEKQKKDESFQKLYKLIANNLYFSSNFTNSTERFENTTGGECLISYGHYIVTDTRNTLIAKKEYMNIKWPDVHVVEKVDMEKWVNLDKCTHQQNYFPANEQIHSFIPANSDVKLETSKGELYVTPGHITSENINTYNVTNKDEAAAIATLHEHFRVQLSQGDITC